MFLILYVKSNTKQMLAQKIEIIITVYLSTNLLIENKNSSDLWIIIV